MKTTALLSTLALLAALLGGCATAYPVGSAFTDVKLPVAATASAPSDKLGTAQCMSIMSVVALGDCSIAAAKANGGISQVSSIDWQARNILGVYGKYTLTVRGK